MNSTVYAVDEYGNEAKDVCSGYVGEFKKFGFSGVPKHCLACDGSEISRATYSELFEVFGETYGSGDGETTFNLPDFRGAFLRCIGGNAAAFGVEQGDAIRDVQGTIIFRGGGLDSAQPDGILAQTTGAFSHQYAQMSETVTSLQQNLTNKTTQQVDFSASYAGVPVANENRPINYAVNVCVVYE